MGKLISVPNHPKIAAEILKPYVRHEVYCMVSFHQDFQGRYYYEHLGMDPNLREQHRGQPWYSWPSASPITQTEKAFDPTYETESLEHFEPMVNSVFAQAHRSKEL